MRRPGDETRIKLVVYADGSITPEQSGVGVAVLCDGQIVQVRNKTLPTMTSNEAEYAALKLALETALAMNADEVEIRMDNEVVVNQMIGNFRVNSPRLKRWHQEACILARQLPRVRYTYIPRDRNSIADALAGEASSGRQWQSAI